MCNLRKAKGPRSTPHQRGSGRNIGTWFAFNFAQSLGLNMLPVKAGMYRVRIDIVTSKSKAGRVKKLFTITLRPCETYL